MVRYSGTMVRYDGAVRWCGTTVQYNGFVVQWYNDTIITGEWYTSYIITATGSLHISQSDYNRKQEAKNGCNLVGSLASSLSKPVMSLGVHSSAHPPVLNTSVGRWASIYVTLIQSGEYGNCSTRSLARRSVDSVAFRWHLLVRRFDVVKEFGEFLVLQIAKE